MTKRTKFLAHLLCTIPTCIMALSSCSSHLIGRSVPMEHPSVCSFHPASSECSVSRKHFHFDYTISQTAVGEYEITGTATATSSLSDELWNYKATFTLYIIGNDEKIAETFTIAGGSGDTVATISFSREFSYKDTINATTIGYSVGGRG